jgi:ketosteroid isomerase-like protein
MSTPALALLVLALASGCASRETRPADAEAEISALLDGWHRAASRADEAGYLGLLAPAAHYLGTDPGERWSRAEFAAFVEPYFARGRGWTYEPRERHVELAPSGDVAWFDEKLWNETYGDCRGTGVLLRQAGTWKLAHYSLTLLVPNEATPAVIEVIRAGPRGPVE